jgi:alkanesulfonate monooxygenase SsuD/methylene tetrahydromethanopterin reductase-like flavin-dependent oxidoreductase (luciferase family)
MAKSRIRIGLTIPNRGPLIYPDKITADLLLELAVKGEENGFHSVWVGDSIMAKPRLESTTLLAAIAARTSTVKLGVACMASFPLRHPILTALTWATLDQISKGRTILVACMGGGSREAGGDFLAEFKNMGVEYGKRAKILEENIEIIKALWTRDKVNYDGQFHKLKDATLEPKPYQKPRPPIWLVSNPYPFKPSDEQLQKGLRRVARIADGWMTTLLTPDQFKHGLKIIEEEVEKIGKDPKGLEAALYYNINLVEDEEVGFNESKDFLDRYYMANYSPETINLWVAYGRREKCLKKLEEFIEAGAKVITLRLTTTRQMEMLKRVAQEILPNF